MTNPYLEEMARRTDSARKAIDSGFTGVSDLRFDMGRWTAQLENPDGYGLKVDLGHDPAPIVPYSKQDRFAVYGVSEDNQIFIVRPDGMSDDDFQTAQSWVKNDYAVGYKGQIHELSMTKIDPEATTLALQAKGLMIKDARIVGVADGKPINLPVEAAHPGFLIHAEKKLDAIDFTLDCEGQKIGGRTASQSQVSAYSFRGEFLGKDPTLMCDYLLDVMRGFEFSPDSTGRVGSQDIAEASEVVVNNIPTGVPLSVLMQQVMANPEMLYSMSDKLAEAGLSVDSVKSELEGRNKDTAEYLMANFIEVPDAMKASNNRGQINRLLAILLTTGNLSQRYWNQLSSAQKKILQLIAGKKGVYVRSNGKYQGVPTGDGYAEDSEFDIYGYKEKRIGLPSKDFDPAATMMSGTLGNALALSILSSIENPFLRGAALDGLGQLMNSSGASGSPYLRGLASEVAQKLYDDDSEGTMEYFVNSLGNTNDPGERQNHLGIAIEIIARCNNTADPEELGRAKDHINRLKDQAANKHEEELIHNKFDQEAIIQGKVGLLIINYLTSLESKYVCADAPSMLVNVGRFLDEMARDPSIPWAWEQNLFKNAYKEAYETGNTKRLQEAVRTTSFSAFNTNPERFTETMNSFAQALGAIASIKNSALSSDADKEAAQMQLMGLLRNPKTQIWLQRYKAIVEGDDLGLSHEDAEKVRRDVLACRFLAEGLKHEEAIEIAQQVMENPALAESRLGGEFKGIDHSTRAYINDSPGSLHGGLVSRFFLGDEKYAFDVFNTSGSTLVNRMTSSGYLYEKYQIDDYGWLARRFEEDVETMKIVSEAPETGSGEITAGQVEKKLSAIQKALEGKLKDDDITLHTAKEVLKQVQAGEVSLVSEMGMFSLVLARELPSANGELKPEDLQALIERTENALQKNERLSSDIKLFKNLTKDNQGVLPSTIPHGVNEATYARLRFLAEMLESRPGQEWSRVGLRSAIYDSRETTHRVIENSVRATAVSAIRHIRSEKENFAKDAAPFIKERLQNKFRYILEESSNSGSESLVTALDGILKAKQSFVQQISEHLGYVPEDDQDQEHIKLIEDSIDYALGASLGTMSKDSKQEAIFNRRLILAIVDGSINGDQQKDIEDIASKLFGSPTHPNMESFSVSRNTDEGILSISSPGSVNNIKREVINILKESVEKGQKIESGQLAQISRTLGTRIKPEDIAYKHSPQIKVDHRRVEKVEKALGSLNSIINRKNNGSLNGGSASKEDIIRDRSAIVNSGLMMSTLLKEIQHLSARDLASLSIDVSQCEASVRGGGSEPMLKVAISTTQGDEHVPLTSFYMQSGLSAVEMHRGKLDQAHIVSERNLGDGDSSFSNEVGQGVSAKSLSEVSLVVSEAARLGVNLSQIYNENMRPAELLDQFALAVNTALQDEEKQEMINKQEMEEAVQEINQKPANNRQSMSAT